MKQNGKPSFKNRCRMMASLIIVLPFLLLGVGIAGADETGPIEPSVNQDLALFSATDMAEKIRSRTVSSVDVVRAVLDRIEKYNPALNAIVTLDKDGALLKAAEADAALVKGEIWGPLHGVPITIKDNLATSGMKTTNSMDLTASYIPDYDATVVTRLRKAGAIIIGKTNLPALAMDYQTRSPLFGVTNNPWDLERTPGGSTGGGAAAVAACLTPLEIGNDIGGSIRIPAGFCGIYGLKPTEHLVPATGISPGLPGKEFRSVRHLLSVGPLARSIADLRLSLGIMAGPDPNEPEVPELQLTRPSKKEWNRIRIAWTDSLGGIPVSDDTQAVMDKLAQTLSEKGCTVVKAVPPDFDFMDAWQSYGKVIDMEIGIYTPSFARFLQFVLGASYRKNSPTLTMVFPMSYEKYLIALTKMDEFRSKMDRFLSEYDMFLCPVHPTSAFKHIEPDSSFGPYSLYKKNFMVDSKPLTYMMANSAFTTIFNLTGHPVVTFPAGYTAKNLPVGVQAVGSRWKDMELLDILEQLDQIIGEYKRPPGY